MTSSTCAWNRRSRPPRRYWRIRRPCTSTISSTFSDTSTSAIAAKLSQNHGEDGSAEKSGAVILPRR